MKWSVFLVPWFLHMKSFKRAKIPQTFVWYLQKPNENASAQTNKDRSKRMKAHLESPLHCWCVNFTKLEAEHEEGRQNINKKILY